MVYTNHSDWTHADGCIPLNRNFHDIWAGVALVSSIGVVFGAFYSAGYWIGNPSARLDSRYIVLAALLACRKLISQVVVHLLSTSALAYVASTLLFQIGAATLFRQHEGHPNRSVVAQPNFLKPMVFPCRTTHTRLFPTRHSLSYSYLFVGIPIGWQGCSGTLLSYGELFENRTWYSVSADDYLARGKHRDGLVGKLAEYLVSQGVPPGRYPYAYLMTAPRLFGFSFNPVSFWYLYDHEKALSAMILEVNNTFDERRMYFMQRTMDKSVPTRNFSSSWSKDFHVSPFNDRDGSYSLTAKDFMGGGASASVDNNIVLHDQQGKPKIVARVFSTESGLEPADMGRAAVWSFMARWWWVGFMTNLRILKEARTLWVKKLQVFYRPEVLQTSIGRSETREETIIEPYFRAFLIDLTRGERPTRISYLPVAGPDKGKIIMLDAGQSNDGVIAYLSLDIHVLTPAFYAEVVRIGSLTDAVARFCFHPTVGQAMVHVSDHGLLQQMLEDHSTRRTAGSTSLDLKVSRLVHKQLLTSGLRNGLLRPILQCSLSQAFGTVRLPVHPPDFDSFVSLSHDCDSYEAYLDVARTILLADRVAFGFGGLLNFYRRTTRLICIAQLSNAIASICCCGWTRGILLSLFTCTMVFHTASVVLG